MSEWKEVKLGMLGNIITGKTPRTAIEDNYGGTIPFLTPSDDMSVKHVVFTKKTLSEKGVAEVKNCLLPCGAVCVSCIGSDLGKVVITTGDTITNQQINSIIVNENNNNDFVYYLLSIVGRELNRISKTSTAVPIINKSTFSSYEIKIPDLFTQQEIAGILSSLDAKIETNNKLNEKLEEMAQAIFKSWFVDFEPFKDKPFHETELGMIPEGWEVGSLSDIATITMGQSPCGTSYNENGEGIIFYQGRTEFGFRFPSIRLYTTAPSRFAEVGSTLMSVRAPVGDINMALLRCCIGRGVASIKSNCDCDSYIYYLMKSLKKRFDIYNGEGTVFGSVGRDTLRGMLITIPPSSVISDFEMNISKIDSRIKTNELESQRLASLRDTLLPRLMSGELIV